jgi:tetratricopeptide (TPR) repeat protein
LSPTDASVFAEGDSIHLIGDAWDPQDGILEGASLTWSSDVDGTLGQGSNLTVASLSLGGQQITLTGTDSHGHSAFDLVSINISVPESAYVNQGWNFFENASYDSARARFESAIAIDPTYADAHNGLGWSVLYLGFPPSNEPIDEAITAFLQAITRGLFAADPQVGLAFAYQSEGEYSPAVQYAQSALNMEPTYSFRHRDTINYLDIRLVLAQSYFGQGEDYFPQAQAEVDILDPDNGLDPQDETTWAVDLDRDGEIEVGETYSSYTEALMELIDLLQQEIFG